jgi:hypothetical protein
MKYSAKGLNRVAYLQQIEQRVERPATPPAGVSPPTRADLIFGPKPVPWVHTNQARRDRNWLRARRT